MVKARPSACLCSFQQGVLSVCSVTLEGLGLAGDRRKTRHAQQCMQHRTKQKKQPPWIDQRACVSVHDRERHRNDRTTCVRVVRRLYFGFAVRMILYLSVAYQVSIFVRTLVEYVLLASGWLACRWLACSCLLVGPLYLFTQKPSDLFSLL